VYCRSAAAASAYQERLGSPSIKPIKTRSTPRSSGGGSQKAVTPAGAAAGGKVPEQSAGSGSGSSSTAGSPGAPAGSSGQQLSRPKQQHAHPFAQADAAGKELQAAFPVLHTTYSTDGGVSEAGSGVLGSSLHSQALGSEASGQSASKGSRERSSGRKGSSSSAQSTPKSARRGTPRGGAGGAGAGVPDFKAMHEKWEAQQAAKKAANAKRTTVPEVSRWNLEGLLHMLEAGSFGVACFSLQSIYELLCSLLLPTACSHQRTTTTTVCLR
jgi:hypothetical protein